MDEGKFFIILALIFLVVAGVTQISSDLSQTHKKTLEHEYKMELLKHNQKVENNELFRDDSKYY